MMKRFFICLLLFSYTVTYAQKTLQITDFGATPDSWNDAAPAIKKALEACRGQENITLNFPKGRYDLWSSRCESEPAVPMDIM